MKILIAILLVIWFIFTLILTVSIIGLVVIFEGDSEWMSIGKKLTNKLIETN